MKNALLLVLALVMVKNAYCGGPKPLIEYKANGQNIDVYQKTFSGIWYILLKNNNKGYSIVCELNKGRKVFMWKGAGNSFLTYNAVIDSVGSKFVGFHEISLDKNVTPSISRIQITELEIELLIQGISKCTWPEAKNYPYDLRKILFFGYAPC